MPDTIEAKLSAMGITLPSPPSPIANYAPFTIAGNLLFISGQGPRTAKNGGWKTGRVGERVTVNEAYQDARLAAIQILAVAKAALGSLDRVHRILKVVGFVNASPDFRSHPAVINGCSDLLVEVLGERGRHARSAVGVNSLPEDITVEIEAILEIEPG
jgi:enamine deaminase RidA (YjgF/YER057c/UK114 family)